MIISVKCNEAKLMSFLVIVPCIAQSLLMLSVNIYECVLCVPKKNYTQTLNKTEMKNEILFRMPWSCWNLNSEKSHSPNCWQSYSKCTSQWLQGHHPWLYSDLELTIIAGIFRTRNPEMYSNTFLTRKLLTFSDPLRKWEKDTNEIGVVQTEVHCQF